MSYQSASFMIFTAVALLLFYIVPKDKQKYVLLSANIFFYCFSGIKYLPFICVTLLATFLAGRVMGTIYEREKELLKLCQTPAEKKEVRAKSKKKARGVLLLGLTVAVALLVVCKYTGFILTNVNSLMSRFGLGEITVFKMILPLGISFYTFMAVSYVLDIYWKRYTAEKSLLNYALFLTYFPHVIQGPIDRYNKIKAQMPDEGISFDSVAVSKGAELALWGLFKKLVIADRLGIFVNEIYGNYTEYEGLIIIIATVLYSVQIYADFSGCIDIVSGVSEMFGIKLAKNFDHPYFSKTMPEFWRRWHVSLGEWFKDYIFYPVSVSKLVKKVKKNPKSKKAGEMFASCFPAFVVWVITGIWHGASWGFVTWGMFHAVLIISGTVFAEFNSGINSRLRIDTESFSWKLWQMTRTFILCCIGRVFFITNGLSEAFAIFARAFSGLHFEYIAEDALYSYGLDKDNFFFAIVSIFVLWAVDMLQERMKIREALEKQNIIFRWTVIFLGIFAVIIFGIYGPGFDQSSFIYEQF